MKELMIKKTFNLGTLLPYYNFLVSGQIKSLAEKSDVHSFSDLSKNKNLFAHVLNLYLNSLNLKIFDIPHILSSTDILDEFENKSGIGLYRPISGLNFYITHLFISFICCTYKDLSDFDDKFVLVFKDEIDHILN